MLKFASILLVCGVLCRAADSGAVQYGKQLVQEVAKCGDCHTPRNAAGEFDASNWLKGATSPKPSPDLTSTGRLFAQWRERGMVEFLETGLDPQGHAPASHMPAYKLPPHDAKAIVAYLKTLK